MGCDGGTIPTRGELVKTKKKPEQLSKETELSVKWQHCAVSQEPLRQPVVACRLGNLFNKEALIEYLLTKTSGAQGDSKLDHIRGLRDIKELRLTPNPAYREESDTKAGAGSTVGRGIVSKFICPVTGLEMNGRFGFCYVRGCGCVLSERALQEVKDVSGCLLWGGAFNPSDDIITINGDAEQVEKLKEKLEAEKSVAKANKKNKRSKDAEVNGSASDDPLNKKRKEDSNEAKSSILAFNTTGDKETWKTSNESEVKRQGQHETGKGEATTLKNGDSCKNGVSTKSGDSGKGKKLMKNGSDAMKTKSIQDDANATEAYKSLFNTHPTALKQGKAHWVTYNPQYN